MSFKVTAAGTNAKISAAVPDLLAGGSHSGSVDAHAIQPYYAGLLARQCGLSVSIAMEGDAVAVTAR
jgi:histidine phosphotransferase ChpT